MCFQEIQLEDERIESIRAVLEDHLQREQLDRESCSFFLRFKSFFVTFHAEVYDDPYKCKSFIVSFRRRPDSVVEYGNVRLFVKYRSLFLVFIQSYVFSSSQLASLLDIPPQMDSKLRELFPLLALSNDFCLLSVSCLQHKCVRVPFRSDFCITEFRIDFEHD